MGSTTNPIGQPPTSIHASSGASTILQPTWYGFVSDTKEALQLFEAVLIGQLSRVIRRPHDRERSSLIRSGNVFIYEESASGIKRWTDGLPWSPSRILGNFLIYRELEKPFPPGEKKRASKKPKRPNAGDYPPTDGDSVLGSPTSPSTPSSPGFRGDDRDTERSLIGSLTDSYAFRSGGLIKKTMSVTVNETHLHLVSYYSPEDVKANMLPRVSQQNELGRVQPRQQLTHGQNFRAPIDESDEALQQQQQQQQHHHSHHQYTLAGFNRGYVPAPTAYLQHSTYLPSPAYSMSHSNHPHQAAYVPHTLQTHSSYTDSHHRFPPQQGSHSLTYPAYYPASPPHADSLKSDYTSQPMHGVLPQPHHSTSAQDPRYYQNHNGYGHAHTWLPHGNSMG